MVSCRMALRVVLGGLLLSLTILFKLFISLPLRFGRFWVSILGPKLRPGLRIIVPNNNFLDSKGDLPVSFNLLLSCKLDGVISLDELTERFKEKCLHATRPENPTVLLFPELREKIVIAFGYPFWTKDPDFNISNHILEWTGANEDSFAIEQSIIKTPFEGGVRSPWKMYLVYGEDCTQVMISFHHALADGGSMYNLLMKVVTDANLEGPFARFPLSKWDIFRSNPILFPGTLVKDFLKCEHPPPFHVKADDMSDDRFFVKSSRISKELIKGIAAGNGVSFSAVLTSAVVGGLMKTMKGLNQEIPEYLGCPQPIPLKSTSSGLGNSLQSIYLALPLRIENYPERLEHCSEMLKRSFHSGFPLFIRSMLYHSNSLPLSWKPKEKMPPIPMFLVSFPGPKDSVFFSKEKKRVSDMHFLCNGSKELCLVFTTLTYTDGLRIALSADPKAFQGKEKLQELMDSIEKEFELMKHNSNENASFVLLQK